MNTKLNIFCVTGYKSEDPQYIFEKMMLYFGQIKHICCYKFSVPMPVMLEVETKSNKVTKKKLFGKDEVVDEPWYHYNLVFDVELTEQELNMWRMFKMGWRARTPFRSFDH